MLESIERIWWRLRNLVNPAKVTTGNDTKEVQLLQVQLGPDEIRDNVKRLAEFGFASMPPPGSDAVVLFVGGDKSAGVVIATGSQTYRLKNLGAGEAALYDAFGKYIKLTQNGIVIEANNQPVTVNHASAATVNVTGTATINAGEIDLVGTGGTAKGVVQADCLCAYTGAPHGQISAKVKGSM